jgi:hypothetical protein
MKIVSTLILTILSNILFGQMHLLIRTNDQIDLNDQNATEIHEELMIGGSIIKYHKLLNARNQIIVDERNDGKGNFLARYTFTYDSLTGLKTSQKKEFGKNSGEININIDKFEYDANRRLVTVIRLDKSERIFEIVRLTNNEKGHPITLEQFTGDGHRTGSERVTYSYEDNTATFDQMDSQGNPFNSGSITIDYEIEKQKPKPGFEYDLHGNLIKFPNGYREIQYDRYGNWTSIKTYAKSNEKYSLSQEQRRRIEYRD